MRVRIASAAAALLLAGCVGTNRHQPPHVFPAAERAATVAKIDAFLPQAQAEAAQCEGEDRRLLDTYLSGLRGLRLAPDGGAQTARETISLFDKAYRDCRQKMAVLEGRLAGIDARCRDTPTRLGMTAPQVLKSCWGAPDHIDRGRSTKHSHEEWVYPGLGRLYFTNGVLTGIDEAGPSRQYMRQLGKPG
jgi:hypothetical protein